MKLRNLLFFLLLSMSPFSYSQEKQAHVQSEDYEWPADKRVLQQLSKWQDLKFGVIFHWGLYSVPGILESWALCTEDEEWITRDSTMAYEDYKKWYWGLKDGFNPINFNPEQWADVMDKAGMKYMIFTTKHHDGFAMYDTKYSDFSVANYSYKWSEKRDVARFVFDAFRKKSFMIGAYYSKPDWHSPYYWWSRYGNGDRNVNYDIKKHPERWNAFKDFVYNQISELMTDYGRIDILWLDGGWVRPPKQDINMEKIASMARDNQPGILIVDRTVPGKFENYQTPECLIPEKQLPHPWETCMTLSDHWSWFPNAEFKSANVVISMLSEVVAKGGNMVLGVGPTPDGIIEKKVEGRLLEIGRWLHKNGEAIYGTRTTKNYHSGNIWFTADKNDKTLYAIYTLKDNEEIPDEIEWKGNIPAYGTGVYDLATGKKIAWKSDGARVFCKVPKSIIARKECFVLKFAIKK